MAANNGRPRWSSGRRGCIRRCRDFTQELLDGQKALGMRHLEQAEFEMETLLLFVS
jgi:hypothetical protein